MPGTSHSHCVHTRTAANDHSGDLWRSDGRPAIIFKRLLPDDFDGLVQQLQQWSADQNVDVVITTGGTGVTGRDATPEALKKISDKDIEGFGELFRSLSFAKIGTSTIQSRACAVVSDGTYIFALPGSKGAVCDGWDDILVHQLDIRHRPCNFVELLPRLKEK